MGCGSSTQQSGRPTGRAASTAQPAAHPQTKITENSPEFKNALAKTKALFVSSDKDRNGGLDVQEFLALLGIKPSPYMDRVLTLFDLDDSNLVTFKEFCVGMTMVKICFAKDNSQSLAQMMAQKDASSEFMYQLFDLNNDGKLSKKEIRDAVEDTIITITDEDIMAARVSPHRKQQLIHDQELMQETCDDCMQHLDTLHKGAGPITKKEFYALANRFPEIFGKGEQVYLKLAPYLQPCDVICQGMGWKPVLKSRTSHANISGVSDISIVSPSGAFEKNGSSKGSGHLSKNPSKSSGKHVMSSSDRAAVALKKRREHEIIEKHNEAINRTNRSLNLHEVNIPGMIGDPPEVYAMSPDEMEQQAEEDLRDELMKENNHARRLRQGYTHDNEKGDAYVFAFSS